LRAKIYKKVKPKTLNGKAVTGEMLLELAHAYTDAINKGSVPNIQNAWVYVCQNECTRAIEEGIRTYSDEMKDVVRQAQLSLDEGLIKTASKQIREKCIVTFKEKALGQDISDFEITLRDGISKK